MTELNDAEFLAHSGQPVSVIIGNSINTVSSSVMSDSL